MSMKRMMIVTAFLRGSYFKRLSLRDGKQIKIYGNCRWSDKRVYIHVERRKDKETDRYSQLKYTMNST